MNHPYNLSKEEVIRRIEQIYHQKYNQNLENFDVYDQLLACEAVEESTPVEETYYKEKEITNENVSVNESDNDTYRREVNFELTDSKRKVIAQLQACTYKTPPIEIFQLLKEFFRKYESNERHWLWVAQTYTPRILNWVMSTTVKEYLRGGIRTNPAKFFTFQLRYRKKRKQFRNTNDTR